MDGIANVAKQQQSQVSRQDITVTKAPKTQQIQQTKPQQQELINQVNQDSVNSSKKLNSQKDVEKLTQKLNEAIAPLNTNIKFGVDENNTFYVSVIDTKTNRVIRRFPAEEAQKILPKMQEVTGILFDKKG